MVTPPNIVELRPIPGLPPQAFEALLGVLAAHRPASDVDLTLRGERLRHGELNDDLRAYVQRVGQLVLRRAPQQPQAEARTCRTSLPG